MAIHAEAMSLVAGVTPSWREILYSLDCPRFFLFGSQSLPDPDREELPRHGVSTLVVPNCGHNMAWETPAGVADGIVPCLKATREDHGYLAVSS
jgi:pimeloyl-ACP methyl ester carboxylesterase